MSMFRRILEMRKKLEGIIQLQTIKYQRQLAVMLKDSKQRANANGTGAGGGGAAGSPAPGAPGAASPAITAKAFLGKPNKFGNNTLKTGGFTPFKPVIESPSNFFASNAHLDDEIGQLSSDPSSNALMDNGGGGGSSGHMMTPQMLPVEEEKKEIPRLGANIYAGNLKMIRTLKDD